MRNKKGFTLIELLVVISIIALLLSIMMPALDKVKRKAASVVCRNNLKQLGMAWFMYADANEGKLVPAKTNVGGWVDKPNSWDLEERLESIKRGLLYPYLESTDVYHCSGDKRLKKTLSLIHI